VSLARGAAGGRLEGRSGEADTRRSVRKIGILFASAAAMIAVACAGSETLGPAIDAGLKSCSAGTAIFTTPPIRLDSMAGWVPLGNLNPPGHTFPTDHQYLYLPFTNASSAPTAVGVVAPGHVFVTRAKRTVYSTRTTADYAVEFSPCKEVHGEYGHLQTMTPSLLARLGDFDQGCQTYSPDVSTTVASCYTKTLGVELAAGSLMGTAGGVPGVLGLDFLLFDNRIAKLSYANESRWGKTEDGFDHFHVVAASDYFAEPTRTQIAAKLGSADGHTRRTVAPYGGTIATDIPGTAQGTWFMPDSPTYPESQHFAFVPDNVDPTLFVLSFGTGVEVFGGTSQRFAPKVGFGLDNRSPARINASQGYFCYSFAGGGGLLLRMLDTSALEVWPYKAGSCDLGPHEFSKAVRFVR
jgi:hypothetical protein